MAFKNSMLSASSRKMMEFIMPRRWVRVRSLYCFSITTARANCSGLTNRLMTDSLEVSYSRMTAKMSLGGICSSTTMRAWSPSASANSTKAASAAAMSPEAIRLWVLAMRVRAFMVWFSVKLIDLGCLFFAVEALLDHPSVAGFFAGAGFFFFFVEVTV